MITRKPTTADPIIMKSQKFLEIFSLLYGFVVSKEIGSI